MSNVLILNFLKISEIIFDNECKKFAIALYLKIINKEKYIVIKNIY